MTREEVRDLFWKTEAFYCYEDSALAIEAQLCGCPTVFVANEFFYGTPLASFETGRSGSETMTDWTPPGEQSRT